MKKVPRSARKKARLVEHLSPARAQEFDRRLLAYALAGAGAVALAPAATAEIVYTPADIEVTDGVLQLDLNHDDIVDLAFIMSNSGYSSAYSGYFRVGNRFTRRGTEVVAHHSFPYPIAKALPVGRHIGPDSPFAPIHSQPALMASVFCPVSYCWSRGPWARAFGKFLGIQFEINGEIHYAWIRLSVRARDYPIKAKLTGYAYETEPNKTILAGDRGFGPEASSGAGHPEDVKLRTDRNQQVVSLGLLSLGSIGLDSWRQPKQDWVNTSKIEEKR